MTADGKLVEQEQHGVKQHDLPPVQAELVSVDDRETRRLRARARKRNALFTIWLAEAPGTFEFKFKRSMLLLEETTDPKEHEKLLSILRRIRGLLESCAAPAPDPDDAHDQEGAPHARRADQQRPQRYRR
jgi:hypothetical protein